MDFDSVVTLARNSFGLAFLISSPVLITGIVVGLIVGIFQAVTQIQDQTISFVLKILSMSIVFILFLPWIIGKIVDFSHELLENIPETTTSFLL